MNSVLSLFLVGLEFELRASGLQKQVLYYLSHTSSPPTHFALVVLEMGCQIYLPGLALNHNPPDLSLPSR
jgi:hypothetical protein